MNHGEYGASGSVATCGLYGHSIAVFDRLYGHDARRLLDYQLRLYQLVDELIAAGTRRFVTLLEPSVALWLAEYVVLQRNSMEGHTGIRLHVIRTTANIPTPRARSEELLAQANSIEIVPACDKPTQFEMLTALCDRMLIIKSSTEDEIFCAYTEQRGRALAAYDMRALVEERGAGK